MKDWRLDAYDEMIKNAEWLRDHPDSNEILPYFRSWVANTAERIRLFPGGSYIANNEFERSDHLIKMLDLERGETDTLPIYMEKWISKLKMIRLRLIDILKFPPETVRQTEARNPQYHLFISYASEDKEAFVSVLVNHLQWLHLNVWYDDTELKIGDSIRRSIDSGIVHSMYGVVVLSPAYLAKKWTQYELDGLIAREGIDYKVLLPIWYNLNSHDLLAVSPTLAQRVALDASRLGVKTIAYKIAEAVSSVPSDQVNSKSRIRYI